MQGRTLLQQMSDKSLPHPFPEEEISAALQKTKPATAPGYDNIHVEFLKNLAPKARMALSKFFSRIMATHSIPKIWRKTKVIAVEKPGKDPSLAASYRPVSLLSVCYNLQAPGESCTPMHFSHRSRPWAPWKKYGVQSVVLEPYNGGLWALHGGSMALRSHYRPPPWDRRRPVDGVSIAVVLSHSRTLH